ncbi:MAG: MmcQ/YjbR family DNA-binding protein [Ruminococcus sp.]|nr:MmcQ/YjbR family DNA-binding protein [Ruminococcus sp.]
MKESSIMTQQILEYISKAYNAQPEYLWLSTPTNAALRNQATGKWFGVLLGALPLKKLGMNSEKKSDVLNLKCDPMLSFALIDNKRIFQGYHMNKEHWISIRLDSGISFAELKSLVDMSFELVNTKASKPHKSIKSTPKKINK